jgi:hypothetical protein
MVIYQYCYALETGTLRVAYRILPLHKIFYILWLIIALFWSDY